MRNRSGFSLLEAIFGIFLLALVLALFLRILPFVRAQQHIAEESYARAFLAQSVLEEWLTVEYRQWPEPGTTFPIEGTAYSYRIQAPIGLGGPNMRILRVDLLLGNEPVYSLETMVRTS